MLLFDTNFVKKRFTQIATCYEKGAILYCEVADRLIAQLEWIAMQPRTLLDLGSGTGYITQSLEKYYPYAHKISLDFAFSMLATFALKGINKKTALICADALQLPFRPNTLDLVICNMMLPWCNSIAAVLNQVQQVLKPDGLFLFSTFGPDTLGELRASWATVDDQAHIHLFYDAHDIGDVLLQAGFHDPVMQTEWLTILYTNAADLFQDLKNTGSTNLLLNRWQTLTGKKRYQQFLTEYDSYKNKQGKLPATFELIYGHCWKKTATYLNNIPIYVQ